MEPSHEEEGNPSTEEGVEFLSEKGAPLRQVQLRSDPQVYCRCYCEENVLRLAAHSSMAAHLESLHMLLISSPAKSVLMLRQQAGQASALQHVVWDYHVLLLTPELVYDLDTTLPFPSATAAYFAASFMPCRPELSPCFRLLSLAEYTAHFSSDRRHMLDSSGQYQAPPPPWPPIRGTAAASEHSLPLLLSMGEGEGAGAAAGRVFHAVPDLLAALAAGSAQSAAATVAQ